MSGPVISVCVPTYNFAAFLPQAIESILCQTFSDFELLVVDDCSTDNSAEVVDRYVARDRRVRMIVNSRNVGMVRNWNVCTSEARGEYIKFVFADDFLTSPDALKRLLAAFESDGAVALAASARYFADGNGSLTQVVCPFKRDVIMQGTGAINRCLAEQKNLIGEPTAVMFRKAVAARGFDLRYNQLADEEMWFYLLEKGDFAHIKEPLCAFRIHPSQQSARNTNTKSAIDDIFRLNAEYLYKDYVKVNRFSRRYAVFDNLYRLWKFYAANHVPRSVAAEDIDSRYGYRKFRLIYPFYKSYKPFFKLHRKIRNRWFI